MSGRPHHRGLHHHQHLSAAAADAAGWVESISALNDEHPATALLLGSPPANGTSSGLHRASSAGGVEGSPRTPAAASPSGVLEGVLSPGGVGVGGVKLSPEQEFDAALDHAVDVMLTEVRGGGCTDGGGGGGGVVHGGNGGGGSVEGASQERTLVDMSCVVQCWLICCPIR